MPRVASYDDIIKIATMITKITFKDSKKKKKKKKKKKLCTNIHSILVFPNITRVADFRRKIADVRRNQGVSRDLYVF